MVVVEPSLVSGVIAPPSSDSTYRLCSRTYATRFPSGENFANWSVDAFASRPPSFVSRFDAISSTQKSPRVFARHTRSELVNTSSREWSTDQSYSSISSASRLPEGVIIAALTSTDFRPVTASMRTRSAPFPPAAGSTAVYVLSSSHRTGPNPAPEKSRDA